jgi:hypothetical protein
MAQCILHLAGRGIDLTRAEWRSEPGQFASALLKERRVAFQRGFAEARFATQKSDGATALQHAMSRTPLDVIDRVVALAQLRNPSVS